MISANSLVKDYGTLRAVDHITFRVEQGEILGFLGPNGAGKSTTMKMVTGFLPPSSGSASIGGHNVLEEPRAAKQLLGYLPESGPLYAEMTALEFLAFAASMRGLSKSEARSRIARVVDICHLEPVRHQTIDTLSKGFRQRVGMAQAMLHDPPVLIMDEPTDGLDPNQKHEVRKLIASMAADKAIVLSTHILEEVEAMCTRVIIIAHGRIIADDTPEGLLRRHPQYNAMRLTLRDPGAAHTARDVLAQHAKVGRVEAENGSLLILPKNKEDLHHDLFQLSREKQWDVTHLESVPMRLDTVFRDLTLPANSPEVA